MSETNATCPECGTELPEGTRATQCPHCLIGLALEVPSQSAVTSDQSPLAPRPSPLATSFGDYELLEEIARGGMGVVWKARQKSLHRLVALKMMLSGQFAKPEFVQRFRAEAQAIAQLQHPNIVAIHEVGEREGQPYFSMDYVQGRTLAEIVREGPLPAQRAATYLKAIAEAVHYAHQHGILHRDLKPSNVLIDASDQPRITDFGLAKRLTGDSELTVTGQVLGSPNYLSPEQAAGRQAEVGTTSDVYALGAMLYHLVTGQPPFQADSLTTLLRQVIETEPVSPRLLNASMPRDLETICLKCLEKETSRRYATAQALADELGRFLRGEPILARPMGPTGKIWRWGRRKPALATALSAVVLVAALGFVGILMQWRRAEQQRRNAEASELLARQNAYAADMNLAQRALEANDVGQAVSLLNKHRPKGKSEIDLRYWEWRYLWQLCQSDELSTLHRYPQDIKALAAAKDGKHLAVASGDQVVLWDLTTKRPLTVLSNVENARLAFVASSGLLAVGSREAAGHLGVALWNVNAGKIMKTLPHPAGVRSLAVSPDGKLLATFDDRGSVRVLDWASDQILTNLVVSQPRYGGAGVVAFSPDGRRLAIGEDYGRIRLLNLQSFALVSIPTPLGEGVLALAFSPTADLLAVGCGYSTGTIRLWNVHTGEPRGELTNHTDDVSALAFTPDGRQLVSASRDYTLRVWNVADGAEHGRLQGSREKLTSLAMLPDGKTLVSGGSGGSVCLWDVGGNHRAPAYTNLAVSAAADAFAEVDAPNFQTNALDPRVVRRFGLAFTPDSHHFVTMDTAGSLVLGDTRALRLLEPLPAFGSNHWGVALSPDGRWLATGDAEGRITIWDWKTRHSVTSFAAPFDYFGLLHFSQSGHYLGASVLRNDQTARVRLWRTGDWAELPLVGDHFAGLWWVALSPDDRRLAVGYFNGVVKLFRFPSLEHETTFTRHDDAVSAVRFSSDGRWLISTSLDGSARLWDVVARREQEPALRGHRGGVWGAAFSPDDRRLATGGTAVRDAVKLWDLVAHRELLSLEGAGLAFFDVSFSPDGTILAATSLAGIAHLWRAPSWEEIAAVEKGKVTP